MNNRVKENSSLKIVFRILLTPTLISVVLLLLCTALSYFISKAELNIFQLVFPILFIKSQIQVLEMNTYGGKVF